MNSSQVALRLAAYDSYRTQRTTRSDDRNSFCAMRMCQDDVIMCLWAFRLFQKRYEVSLFLAEDHYKYVKYSGVMGGLIFILSDAYFKTGSMEIRFCGSAPNQPTSLRSGYERNVPQQIVQFAKSLGIQIPKGNVLSDFQARQLYARITNLPAKTERTLERMGCDLTRACFLVNRGIWTREQMSLIARCSLDPAKILQGGSPPEEWINYKSDLLVLRNGLFHERIHTLLCGLLEHGNAQAVSTWIRVDRSRFALRSDGMLRTHDGTMLNFPKGSKLEARFFPRDAIGYQYHLQGDLGLIAQGSADLPVIIVVTKDFEWIPDQNRKTLLAAVKKRGGFLVPIVDTLNEVDEFLAQKLFQSGSSKRPTPERRE